MTATAYVIVIGTVSVMVIETATAKRPAEVIRIEKRNAVDREIAETEIDQEIEMDTGEAPTVVTGTTVTLSTETVTNIGQMIDVSHHFLTTLVQPR